MPAIVLAAFLCFFGLAASANNLPPGQKDFRALVEKEVPIGTPAHAAKSRIEALGLPCKLVRGGWINNIHDRTEFYFCQREAGNIVLTRWRVTFLPVQDKVSVLNAYVFLVGP